MTEVTVEITQYCPFNCDYCSSDASIEGRHVDYNKIISFLDSQKNITKINISGGEPLFHPRIGDIILYALTKTDNVCIYSNLIRNLRFNSDIVKEVRVEANVCIVPGKNVYISQKVDQVHILKLIHHGRGVNLPKTKVTVSSNFVREKNCSECNHVVFQADGKVVKSPCNKKYNCDIVGGDPVDGEEAD